VTVTAPGRWDIGPVAGTEIVGMPLLQHYTDAHPGALRGVHLLYINHAISDSLMTARAFHRLGATLTSVLVPYHGAHGATQHAIRRAFAALGKSHQARQPHPARFAEVMRAQVTAAIRHAAGQATLHGRPWMIVEDGGYAFPLLHDDPHLRPYLATCLGAVEHTTRGRWNYEYTELDAIPTTARLLDRPALTISGSTLKTAHEAGFVAEALVDEAHFLLRRDHQFLRHRQVAVVGYGRVGRALARQIAHHDADVLVVDPAAQLLLPDGMRHASLAQAVAGGAMLVFGATGTSSFTRQALCAFLQESPADTLYLASASSKAVEFADLIALLADATADNRLAGELAGADATVTSVPDPEIGTRYRIRRSTGAVKHLVLLGNGYPVIFYPADTHGAPNRAMDPVMTQLFLAALGLAAHPNLANRVHDLDQLRALPPDGLPTAWHQLLDEDQLLAQWCHHNHIDQAAYRERINWPAPARHPEVVT
jgi:hypothetical protein